MSSILNSTYRDLELIVVNDGSTDGTAAICDRFASADQRVRVIHKSNAGVSAARNDGLRASTGEFINFVDSDDVIHPQMLETLWKAITSGDYDMSMVLNRKIEADERTHYLNCPLSELGDSKPVIMSQDGYFTAMFTDRVGDYLGPCHKLFKRELLFPDGGNIIAFKQIPAEDVEWLTRLCLKMNKVIMQPLDLYFYVERPESMTRNNGINPVIIGRLETHYQCLTELPQDKTDIKALCLKDIYRRIQLYTFLANGTPYQKPMRAQCKDIYKKTIKDYLRISSVGPLDKFKNMVYYYCPWLYRLILNSGEMLVKHKLIKN